MKSLFRLVPKGSEENVFKKVPDGWLFTTANPAFLRKQRTYLVTEAQKPAIAAQVRRSRLVNLLVVLIEVPLIMLACTKFPWLLTFSLKAIYAWAAVVFVICGLAAVADDLMMRSIVKDLPRTSQKISLADRWKGQSRAMSTGTLVFFTLFGALCAAMNLYTAITQKSVLVGLGAAFMAFLGVYFGTMLVARLRAKSEVNGS